MQNWFNEENPRCLIVAEIAQTHDGSLGAAHAYIDAVANAGADAIKFQTHIAAAESTPGEPWRVKFSRQDATRYDYWKRMEFTEEQWRGLAEHANERGLIFLSSAFSPEAVELLERVGVPAWKVGAGEVSNLPLLAKMARTGKPMILSSGMSDWTELDAAVNCVRENGASVAVLQCTTAYPCPPEKLGLNVIAELRERYKCPVGLSDHSGAIYAGLAAVTLGAKMIEVHVAFSRECFGPDVIASITTPELKQLVEGVRFIERALAAPVDKRAMAEEMTELRRVFGKSIVAARDLNAGERIAAEDIAFKKPGSGIPAASLNEVINRRLKRAVAANTLISEDDLD
ncbi:MAG: N,N'-diacetyllegionaminic acid synthase [Acidobacteria bacterium]|nr:N,N'-diacetyllegionaminic acid synthase [Acidobacteriota bacterium]